MKATLLTIDSGVEHLWCSEERIEFLKLFIFADLATLARHQSLTHHGGLCPAIIKYMELIATEQLHRKAAS